MDQWVTVLGLRKPEDLSSNSERPGRKAISTSPEWAQVDPGGLLASQPNWNNELLTQWESLTFGTEAEKKASGVFLCSQHMPAQISHACGQCAHIHISTFEHFHLATCLVLLLYKDHTISSLRFQYFNFCTDTSFFFNSWLDHWSRLCLFYIIVSRDFIFTDIVWEKNLDFHWCLCHILFLFCLSSSFCL